MAITRYYVERDPSGREELSLWCESHNRDGSVPTVEICGYSNDEPVRILTISLATANRIAAFIELANKWATDLVPTYNTGTAKPAEKTGEEDIPL